MPELPEVETIVNDLNNKIKGEVFTNFWSDWEKGVKIPINKIIDKITNTSIKKTERIGKHILIHLNNKNTIVIHLKMTGHLLFKEKDTNNTLFNERVNQYIHHIFYFKNGATLEFSDLRKFGWINLVATEHAHEQKSIKKLGTDALIITLTEFIDLIKKHNKSKIGIFLLKQDLISGIGNIYRSEILFNSKIKPQRLNSTLNNNEIQRLHKSIKKILKKAIKLRGTTDSDYRDTTGHTGKFQNVLKTYRRENKVCQTCKTIIIREKIAQRSVFYCSKCQK